MTLKWHCQRSQCKRSEARKIIDNDISFSFVTYKKNHANRRIFDRDHFFCSFTEEPNDAENDNSKEPNQKEYEVVNVICNDLRFSSVNFKIFMQIGAFFAAIDNLCSISEEAKDSKMDTAIENYKSSLKQGRLSAIILDLHL